MIEDIKNRIVYLFGRNWDEDLSDEDIAYWFGDRLEESA